MKYLFILIKAIMLGIVIGYLLFLLLSLLPSYTVYTHKYYKFGGPYYHDGYTDFALLCSREYTTHGTFTVCTSLIH